MSGQRQDQPITCAAVAALAVVAGFVLGLCAIAAWVWVK